MKKTGAEITLQLLENEGVKVVAGIPGGSILPLYDVLPKSKIKHILVRHEQAAGFFAQGIARTTGAVGVCFATSGPGAMNLLTALADARSDSVPVVAITGQVNTSFIGTDAFQEADTFGLSFPITKHSILIKSVEELFTAIPLAFQIAKTGRPGPVLIDIPRDIQLAKIEMNNFPKLKKQKLAIKFFTQDDEYKIALEQIVKLICDSKRAVLLCGGGCNSQKVATSLSEFLQLCFVPVVTTLMGIGSIPSSAQNYFGMVGMHGSYTANYAMSNADLVIALGTRFDDRATGKAEHFCPNAKIIHVDLDAAEINKIFEADISVVRDVSEVVKDVASLLATKMSGKRKFSFSEWNSELAKINEKHNALKKRNAPCSLIFELPSFAEKGGVKKSDIIVTTDVGQHQMWASQFYPVEKPCTFITSGSLGTMGFGLPVALGASFANPKKRVICISGDGSILMNIQELATLAELNLQVTIIVFENETLGMVYQQQKYLFGKKYSQSIFEKVPDIVAIARGFGVDAFDIEEDEMWYKKAFAKGKPCLVRVRVSREEDVLPFVLPNTANIDAILPK